jgi:hypothetical protein
MKQQKKYGRVRAISDRTDWGVVGAGFAERASGRAAGVPFLASDGRRYLFRWRECRIFENVERSIRVMRVPPGRAEPRVRCRASRRRGPLQRCPRSVAAVRPPGLSGTRPSCQIGEGLGRRRKRPDCSLSPVLSLSAGPPNTRFAPPGFRPVSRPPASPRADPHPPRKPSPQGLRLATSRFGGGGASLDDAAAVAPPPTEGTGSLGWRRGWISTVALLQPFSFAPRAGR